MHNCVQMPEISRREVGDTHLMAGVRGVGRQGGPGRPIRICPGNGRLSPGELSGRVGRRGGVGLEGVVVGGHRGWGSHGLDGLLLSY